MRITTTTVATRKPRRFPIIGDRLVRTSFAWEDAIVSCAAGRFLLLPHSGRDYILRCYVRSRAILGARSNHSLMSVTDHRSADRDLSSVAQFYRMGV